MAPTGTFARAGALCLIAALSTAAAMAPAAAMVGGAQPAADGAGRSVVLILGPKLSAGCGGLTGVTPLARYRAWIVETARALGSSLAP